MNEIITTFSPNSIRLLLLLLFFTFFFFLSVFLLSPYLTELSPTDHQIPSSRTPSSFPPSRPQKGLITGECGSSGSLQSFGRFG